MLIIYVTHMINIIHIININFLYYTETFCKEINLLCLGRLQDE